MKSFKKYPILHITKTGCSFLNFYSALPLFPKFLYFDLLFIDAFEHNYWSEIQIINPTELKTNLKQILI